MADDDKDKPLSPEALRALGISAAPPPIGPLRGGAARANPPTVKDALQARNEHGSAYGAQFYDPLSWSWDLPLGTPAWVYAVTEESKMLGISRAQYEALGPEVQKTQFPHFSFRRSLRQEIELAAGKGAVQEPPSTPTGSETSEPLPGHDEMPHGWFALGIAIMWGIIAFAFGFEAVVNFNDWLIRGEKAAIVVAGVDLALCFALAAVALILWKRRYWLPARFVQTAQAAATNAYVWLTVAMITFVVLALPHLISAIREAVR